MTKPHHWIRRIPRMVMYNLVMYAIDILTVGAVLTVFVIDPVSDTLRLRFDLKWFWVLVGWAALRAARAFIGLLRTWEVDMQLRVIPDWRKSGTAPPSTPDDHER